VGAVPMTRPRPLRHLPICTPEAFRANDFIPYGLGVTETGIRSSSTAATSSCGATIPTAARLRR
jgi:hypothetical protein